MRLHRLTLQAFGPFPGRVEVDLDALAGAGIFLIHGPTGAGKTSLLDAICFALYAAVPGARPAGRSLRSDHAGADAAPSVTLEFTAGGRRLRIARSAEFRRPKRRGTGEASVPASVSLSELVDGRWSALSHRADEVGEVVRDVLGIGMRQFVKVVLLPQGDFAAFLRATPEARRQLLERLFDVSRFAEVEDWLGERRRHSAAQLERARTALASDLVRVDDVLARLPAEEFGAVPDWAQVPLPHLSAQLSELLAQVRAHAATALVQRDQAEALERARIAEQEQAAHQLANRAKGEAAQAALASLGARREQLEQLALVVDAGRRADAVGGDLRALAQAGARVAQAQREVQAAAVQLGELGLPPGAEPAAVLARLGGFDDCLAQAATCAGSLEAALQRSERQQQLLAHAQAAHVTAEAQVARLVEAMAQAQALVDRAGAGAGELPVLSRARDELTQRRGWRTELDRMRQQLDAARQAERAAHEDALRAREGWLSLRQAHLHGMAARLASGLADGGACPVCGSTCHPRPADPADAVADHLLERAEDETAARDRELASARSRAAGIEGRCDTLRAQLAGDQRDAAALAGELAEATRRHDAAEALAGRLAAHRERVIALGAELDAARRHRDVAAQAARQARGGHEALRGEVERVQQQLAELLARHFDGCPCVPEHAASRTDVDSARPRHGAVAAALTRQLEATRARALAQQDEAATAAAVALRLAEHGFASRAEARGALLPLDTLAGHERALLQADRERVRAEGVLADPQVSASMAAPAEDHEEIAEEVALARTARLRADRAHTLAEHSDRELDRLRAGITAAATRVADLQARHATLARLADTAAGLGGDNLLRMRLSAYVLAARLERVVELANERLSKMGDGRYRLRHSDAPVAGGARSGLDLQIEDMWTGQARDTATLSGGESFVASLALALGLADGVREESGGFDLQTLFVDEGFGALDEDSLEQVLAVLDDLRDGGRAVGVVSHVADLRDRIPCQLRVTKAAHGSHVTLVHGTDGAA